MLKYRWAIYQQSLTFVSLTCTPAVTSTFTQAVVSGEMEVKKY